MKRMKDEGGRMNEKKKNHRGMIFMLKVLSGHGARAQYKMIIKWE
jgi:hypothetical protein